MIWSGAPIFSNISILHVRGPPCLEGLEELIKEYDRVCRSIFLYISFIHVEDSPLRRGIRRTVKKYFKVGIWIFLLTYPSSMMVTHLCEEGWEEL